MINSKAYDIEVLPNFFSITIVNLNDYLKVFNDACEIDSKGKKKPIPLVQVYSVEEIIKRLNSIKSKGFYITDTDDSQLFPMIEYIQNMIPHRDENNIPIRTDMFGYNNNNYDKLMVAGLLMYATNTKNTKELITKLYELSKHIIELQDNKEISRHDYMLTTARQFKLPYIDIDTMTIFALNKVGTGVDKLGNKIYFPKGLKQTSINLQWYELLEYDLPPICEKDYPIYIKKLGKNCPTIEELNKKIDKWDRYIIDEYIPPMMHYNKNDVFIVCEMVRLYIDEVRLRYTISNVYKVDVLSSARSNIADKMFTKFYSEFSGLSPKEWQGKKTERTALSFKRVILPFIQFKTPQLKQLLEEMKKTIIYSIGKDSFEKNVTINKLTYTVATGGLHSKDIPRQLKSKLIDIDSPTGDILQTIPKDKPIWDVITDNSYVYVHWDISDAVPHLNTPLTAGNS